METVEVVIRLPEKTYRKIVSNEYDYGDMNVIIQAGTVLPKGHGRIGDLDKLKETLIDHRYSNDFCTSHHIDNSISTGVINSVLADAPVLIEADREVEG